MDILLVLHKFYIVLSFLDSLGTGLCKLMFLSCCPAVMFKKAPAEYFVSNV
jgi:hypothetical protein